MAKIDETYTLRVGTNEYTVSRKGTECTINVGDNFFSSIRRGEDTRVWARRVSWLFYLDLNKISRVVNVSIVINRGAIIIQMDQPNSWGNIAYNIRDAFRDHLGRNATGDYEG